MKLYIYSTDIEETLKGDFAWSLKLSSRDDMDTFSNYYLLGDIEMDMNIDSEAITAKAIGNIDKSIKDIEATATAAVTELKGRQQSLLALTHEAG